MPPPSTSTRLRRARVAASAIALGGFVLCAAAPAAAADPGELVLRGRGHGHGVGMTHDGALALGHQGRSAEEILGVFYPGTTVVPGGGGVVRVLVRDVVAPGPIAVQTPDGATLRPDRGAAPGLPLRVEPGAVVRLSVEGDRVVASVGATRVTAPSAMLLVPTTVAELSDGSRHRGVLRLVAGPRLRAVAHLDVEDYLRGMGEVRSSSWPAASLRAQAIAARTYALFTARHRPRGDDFDVYADDRSQVYLGAQAEYDAMDRAVAETAGRVVRYDGRLVNAVYSSNGGGVTASATEGFGPSRQTTPYLRPVRYPTSDPKPWTVRMPLDEAARRLDYPGRVTSFRVARTGPSGRVLAVEVRGSAGVRAYTGLAVAERFRLRSTLFSVAQPPAAPAVSAVSAATRGTVVRSLQTELTAQQASVTGASTASERRVATGVACTLLAGVLTGLMRGTRLSPV